MATLQFIPGSIVTKSGFYRVSHSNRHMPDAESHLPKGLPLPSCLHDGCYVLYTFVREGGPLPEDGDTELLRQP
jgi:hypothetical protein